MFMEFPFWCFKFVFFDINPISKNATNKQKLAFFVKNYYFWFIIFSLCSSIYQQLMFTLCNWSDFMEASKNIPNILTGSLITSKAVAVFFKKKDLVEILDELKKLSDLRTDDFLQKKSREYLKSYLKMIRLYVGTMLFVYIPLLIPIVGFFYDGSMKLPINFCFPFNVYRPKIFLLAVAWIEFVSYNFLAFLLLCDSLLYALITIVAMEFDFLSFELRNLKLPVKHERQKTIQNLVERHDKLLAVSDELQSIFDVTFLCCFLLSSLVMCFLAFQVSIATKLEDLCFFTSFFMMNAGQVWLLCFHGQKIIDSSEDLADAVYDCGWEDFGDLKFKKQFLMMLMRGQRAKKLTAMSFGNVSLESFNSVS